MTWNEFKKIIDEQLSKEVKEFEIDFIDVHMPEKDSIEIEIDAQRKTVEIISSY